MDVIEFFEHANSRNLKNTIKSKVHRRLQSINEILDERRLMLRYLLEEGNLNYSKELALLARERIEKAAKDRQEWFGIHRIEREQEIEKFLKLKQLQREMENCETWRHLQSKALLLNTKQAQLYQIKEKESLREKEKEIQQMWHDVNQRYYEEKAKQHNIEVKLLKTISGLNQTFNLQNRECQKRRNKIAKETAKAEFAKDDANTALLDEFYLARKEATDVNKKLKQQHVLLEQIKENENNRAINKKRDLENDLDCENRNLCDILSDEYKKEKQKIHESVWQEHYMYHIGEERQRKQKEVKEFESIFSDTGCVLQQTCKTPYNKLAR